MAKKGLKWFRFYEDWLDNAKVQMLDATLQQRYIMLLCLRCRGEIPGMPLSQLAWHMRIGDDECQLTLDELQKKGLWTGEDVPNWDERQYVSDSSTERSRKHRLESKSTQSQRSSNGVATLQQRPQSQTQKTDTEKKNPPSPRKRVEGVCEVVEYLNQVTGKRFSLDRGNKEIERALQRGATVAECREVIDYLWREWSPKPDMIGHIDKATPFRASNFDRYLDAARAGRPKPGNGGAPAGPIPREVYANLELEINDGLDWDAWIKTQPAAWRDDLRSRASHIVSAGR